MGYYEDLEKLTEHLGDLLDEYRRIARLEDLWAEDATNDFLHQVASTSYAHAAECLEQVLNQYAPGKPGDWGQ